MGIGNRAGLLKRSGNPSGFHRNRNLLPKKSYLYFPGRVIVLLGGIMFAFVYLYVCLFVFRLVARLKQVTFGWRYKNCPPNSLPPHQQSLQARPIYLIGQDKLSGWFEQVNKEERSR